MIHTSGTAIAPKDRKSIQSALVFLRQTIVLWLKWEQQISIYEEYTYKQATKIGQILLYLNYKTSTLSEVNSCIILSIDFLLRSSSCEGIENISSSSIEILCAKSKLEINGLFFRLALNQFKLSSLSKVKSSTRLRSCTPLLFYFLNFSGWTKGKRFRVLVSSELALKTRGETLLMYINDSTTRLARRKDCE